MIHKELERLSDVGLFTTMIFESSSVTGENIYTKLSDDKLPADLGYLYENAATRIIASTNHTLFITLGKKKEARIIMKWIFCCSQAQKSFLWK